jgi:OOP family OmpA-OmpF porin
MNTTTNLLKKMNLGKTAAIALSVLIISCNSGGKKDQQGTENDSIPAAEQTATPTASKAKVFDINAYPVSEKALGAFPYFNLPEGYYNYNKNKPVDYDRAYFWVGDHFEKPEGKIFYDYVRAKEGKSYSDLELSKNIEQIITEAGGVKITESKVPQDSVPNIPENNGLKYKDGYGFIGQMPTVTYLIRRTDRNIWIQHTPTDDGSSIGWMILETKPFKATASLIKAEAMKQELDKTGHIALYVNFDTDKATIKPDSKPVIDEIQKLLNSDPKLRIRIEGHTDNSGAAAHNLKLSEERAKSVKDALVAGGINGTRLESKGLGQTVPLADNGTEDGKAKNRRVEIVKL